MSTAILGFCLIVQLAGSAAVALLMFMIFRFCCSYIYRIALGAGFA